MLFCLQMNALFYNSDKNQYIISKFIGFKEFTLLVKKQSFYSSNPQI